MAIAANLESQCWNLNRRQTTNPHVRTLETPRNHRGLEVCTGMSCEKIREQEGSSSLLHPSLVQPRPLSPPYALYRTVYVLTTSDPRAARARFFSPYPLPRLSLGRWSAVFMARPCHSSTTTMPASNSSNLKIN